VEGVFLGLWPFSEGNQELLVIGFMDLVQGPVLDFKDHKPDILTVKKKIGLPAFYLRGVPADKL